MSPSQNIYESTSTRVSGFILLFFILVSFFWIVGYSFNFSFLRCKGKRSSKDDVSSVEEGSTTSSTCDNRKEQKADPGRTFVFAIIVSLIILLILWAFWSTRRC